MSQTETLQPAAQRWLRYWRNSLADAESGQGALTQKALDQTEYLERTVYRDGYLPSNAISNTVRDAMLARSLVTAQRLRERGVL